MQLDDATFEATARVAGDYLLGWFNGRKLTSLAIASGNNLMLVSGSHRARWLLPDRDAPAGVDDAAAQGELTAPMPGKVIEVPVSVGERVAEGQTVMVIEAMKMEHRLTAPFAGEVAQVHYQAGDLVDEGVELVSLVVAGEDGDKTA